MRANRQCFVVLLQNAVSVFCRLGFAKKKPPSAESGNSDAVHDSWRNVEQQNIITKKSTAFESLVDVDKLVPLLFCVF